MRLESLGGSQSVGSGAFISMRLRSPLDPIRLASGRMLEEIAFQFIEPQRGFHSETT